MKSAPFFRFRIGDSPVSLVYISKKRSYATTNPAIRQDPERHGHAQYRRVHRVGIHHSAFHPGGMVAQRTARAAGRADADLPPAAADRLHRRAQRRRGAGRGNRRHCRRRRDRRQRYSDVHRRDDHGSAGGICDPPVRPHGRRAREGWLRNARQQLLDRHSRHAAGRSGLLCRRQRGLRPDDAHKQRCRAGHTPRTAASCVAFRGTGQGAVSQQRRQSRNLLADRHRTGP